MALLYIFIIGCFVTGIVAVGLVFAMSAVGIDAGAVDGESLGGTGADQAANLTVVPNENSRSDDDS